MTQIRIVGLSGSANPRSSTSTALNRALDGARAAGAGVTSFDLGSLSLPPYQYGLSTPEAEAFMAAVRAAHGMIWCSPLYHGSISGGFKNAIDWLEMLAHDDPPYIAGKVIGLIATAGGEQGLQAINSMEYMVRAMRGWTLPLTAPIARAGKAFGDDGTALDTALDERLLMVGRETALAAAQWEQGRLPAEGADKDA